MLEENPAIEFNPLEYSDKKFSQNVDVDTMPVYFGDSKKCTVNFNFKWVELVSL